MENHTITCDSCKAVFEDKPHNYIPNDVSVQQICDNCIEIKRLAEQQHKWYSFTPVLFEILKDCKNRTIDMLNSRKSPIRFGIRYFYAGKIDFLKEHLDAMGVLSGNKLVNIYRSNALLRTNSIPIFSYDLSNRKDEKYQYFNDHYYEYCEGFDMIFDIDSPKKTMEDAYESAKMVKKEFDSFKIPYIIKPSGYKGFHIICPAQYMPKMKIDELIETIKRVLENFATIHFLEEYIDTSIAHLKGLIKPCYVLDSSSEVVNLPLNDYEFETFNVEKVKVDYVIKNVVIKNRGNRLHTHELSDDELRKNVKEFIRQYK